MGTAASAQASEAMQGVSAEDVQAALGQLSDSDRAKLQEAVAQAQGAPADAAVPADAAHAGAEGEAQAAPADAAKTAEAAAPAVAAPFLAEYFDQAQARTKALLEDEEKLMALALDPGAQKKLKEESKAWFENEAKSLLEKSFKHHDTKNTGVLDKEEAAAFFAHMVQEETDMAKAMSAMSIQAGIKLSLNMLEGMDEEARAQIKPQIEKQMKQAIETAKAEVQKKEDAYKADKATHDAAAFKVLDSSGDGSIQLAEFLAAFEPETELNVNLHIALGYLTKEEVEQQKKMEAQAKEDAEAAADCNQQ